MLTESLLLEDRNCDYFLHLRSERLDAKNRPYYGKKTKKTSSKKGGKTTKKLSLIDQAMKMMSPEQLAALAGFKGDLGCQKNGVKKI